MLLLCTSSVQADKFAVKTFACKNGVMAQSVTGGTVSPVLDSVDRDSWLQLEAFPDTSAGFVFSHWQAFVPRHASITNSFTKVTEVTAPSAPSISICAQFYNTYSLTITASPGGQVSDSLLHNIKHGTGTAISARADRRYRFSHWIITRGGPDVTLLDTFTTATSVFVEADAEINAHFMPLVKLTILDSAGEFIDSLFVPQNVPTHITPPFKRNDFKNIAWTTQSSTIVIDGEHSFTPLVTVQNDGVVRVDYKLKEIYPITEQLIAYLWNTHGVVEDSTHPEMMALSIDGIGKPLRIKAKGVAGDSLTLVYYKNNRLFNHPFQASAIGDSVVIEIPTVQIGERVYAGLYRPQKQSTGDSVIVQYDVGHSVVISSEQGTVSPSNTITLFDGETKSIHAIPFYGYLFNKWVIDSTTTQVSGSVINDSIEISVLSDAQIHTVYQVDSAVQPQIDIENINSYHFPEICFDFSLTDSVSGQVIPKVDRDRLLLWQEHGDSSQIETSHGRIENFTVTQTREKRTVLFAIDESYSMDQYMSPLQDELHSYILHMDSFSQVGILGFDGEIREYTSITSDTAQLNKAVARLRTIIHTSTNTIDAVYRAIESIKHHVGEKAIYLVADGSVGDNFHTVSDVTDLALQYDIAIYSFWIEDSTTTIWERAALLTGGSVIKNIPRDSLVEQLSFVESSLYDDYRLCYSSPDTIANGDRYRVSLETALSVSGQEGKDTTEWIENDKTLKITLTPATDSLLTVSVPIWQELPIGVLISSSEPIVAAQLFYRTTGSFFYDVVDLEHQLGDHYLGTIPHYIALKPGVEFYIAVTSADNQNMYAPYTKLGYPVQNHPYYIAIENSAPEVVPTANTCYIRGAKEFITTGMVLDPEGVTALEIRYQFEHSPLLFNDVVTVYSDGGFNYAIPLQDSLPVEYQFTSRDGYGAQGHFPFNGFIRKELCLTLPTPIATLINPEPGSTQHFKNSAQILFTLNGYSVADSIEIHYRINGADNLFTSTSIVSPGDIIQIHASDTLYFYSMSRSKHFSSSNIDSLSVVKIPQLTQPTIATTAIFQNDTILYKEFASLLVQSIDSTVDSVTVFAELLDSTHQWSNIPFDTLELNRWFNSTSTGMARFYTKAPFALPSDTINLMLFQIPDSIIEPVDIPVQNESSQNESSQDELQTSSFEIHESSENEVDLGIISWIVDRDGDGVGETVYIRSRYGISLTSAVKPMILFYPESDSARIVTPYTMEKGGDEIRLILSTGQSALVSESVMQQSRLYLQVPQEWSQLAAPHSIVIGDSVAPIITGLERVPGQEGQGEIDIRKRQDHFIFTFSKPMDMLTIDTEIFNESFYFNETCNSQLNREDRKAVTYRNIIPIDSSYSQFYVRFDDKEEPLVGGCVGIDGTQAIRDVSGNGIPKQLMNVTGIQRTGVLDMGIFPAVLSLSETFDQPSGLFEGLPIDSLEAGRFGLTLACDSSFSSEVFIYTVQGTFVHHMSYRYSRNLMNFNDVRGEYGTMHYLFWDVRGQDERKVGTGVYLWRVIIRYENGTRERYMLKSGLIR
ncbi:MAG: VWA domain-containing protein [Fibrobacterales bacterium]